MKRRAGSRQIVVFAGYVDALDGAAENLECSKFLQRLIDRRARVFFGMQNEQRRAYVLHERNRRFGVIPARVVPERSEAVLGVIHAETVRTGKIRTELFGAQIADGALGDGRLVA